MVLKPTWNGPGSIPGSSGMSMPYDGTQMQITSVNRIQHERMVRVLIILFPWWRPEDRPG
jgi:hypothetical protein